MANYKQTVFVASLIVAFIILTRFVTLPSIVILWITDFAWTFASGFVAWKCWKTSQTLKNNEKSAWLYFAYAHLAWFVGILIWDYLELVAKTTTPFPAISDIGFLLFTVFVITALLKLKNLKAIVSLNAIQLSKISIIASSIIIIHIIVLSEVVIENREGSLYISVALLYPVLYMSAFLFALSSFWQTIINQRRQSILLIIASIAMHAYVVSIYSYSLLGKTYATGNYIDVMWLIAFGLMYLASVNKSASVKVADGRNSNSSYKIQKNIDVLLVPIAMFSIIFVIYLFNQNLNSEIITLITPFLFLFFLSFTIKEILKEKYQEKLKADIRKSDEKFQIITNTIPGVVYQFCIDKEGKRYFTYVSPRINEMIGLKEDAVINDAETWINQIHPDDRDDFEKSVIETYQNLTPWLWEGRMYHINGVVRWCQGRSFPIKEGDVVTWNGIVLDVTDKRDAEIALVAANENLESRILERTDDLQKAKQFAEIANNAKTEFLSHMSHELRTPLNAILGFAQLLMLDELTDKQVTSTEEILDAGTHLLNLIDEILNLEAIESGKLNIEIEDVEIYDVIEQAIKYIQQPASDNNITIDNHIKSSDNYILLTDEFRFKEVMINLLSNAVKYNIEGGSIKITATPVNSYLKISVTDTGKGIAKDKFKNVFEPFDRLGREASNIVGTGIGLTISKKIIEKMGGEIGFESELNKGSTFWITLPLSNNIH